MHCKCPATTFLLHRRCCTELLGSTQQRQRCKGILHGGCPPRRRIPRRSPRKWRSGGTSWLLPLDLRLRCSRHWSPARGVRSWLWSLACKRSVAYLRPRQCLLHARPLARKRAAVCPPARANACCKREQWHASGWLCQPPAPAPQACVRGYSSASARVSAPHGHRTSMHARLGGHRVHQFPGFAARLPHLTAIRFASADHLHDQRLVRPCEGTVTCSLAATSMGQRQKVPPTPAARVPFCSSLPLSAFNTGRRPRGAQARLLACVLSHPCEPAPGLRAAAIGLPRSAWAVPVAPCNGLLGAAPPPHSIGHEDPPEQARRLSLAALVRQTSRWRARCRSRTAASNSLCAKPAATHIARLWAFAAMQRAAASAAQHLTGACGAGLAPVSTLAGRLAAAGSRLRTAATAAATAPLLTELCNAQQLAGPGAARLQPFSTSPRCATGIRAHSSGVRWVPAERGDRDEAGEPVSIV